MTVTRWKVMAGTLGVSLCGLAALADSPKPPVPVPAPNVIELPPIPAAPTPPAVEPPPVLVPAPTVAAAPPAETAPAPKMIELKLPVEAAPSPTIIPAAAFEAAPAVPTVPTPEPSTPVPTLLVSQPAVAPVPTPEPALAPTPVMLQANVNSNAGVVTPVAAVTQTQTPVTTASVSPSEKKLRVLLNMGEDRPRFEVRDGEETLLRLVSDKVDVKCTEPGDTSAQTMRAVGGVAFVTPGGEGNCDELTLTPGTGQVVVSGKVKFRYHWGKVETEVAGDRMTFRLGTGPAGVVPASYTPGR